MHLLSAAKLVPFLLNNAQKNCGCLLESLCVKKPTAGELGYKVKYVG